MEKIIFLFVVSVSVLANGQSRDASIRAHQSQKLKNTNSKESIQWKIESETKNLNDYRLQKATAMFEGRELTAWFIAEMKISAGHYQLGGLPGKILYVEDSKKDFVYKTNLKSLNARTKKTIVS
jgi:GLPGLI family protein